MMIPNNNMQPTRKLRGGIMSAGLRLVIVMMVMGIFTVPSAFGQTATYSDSWFIDNSPETYNAEYDAYSLTESQNYVAGVGVTEPDYTSDSESVQTTLTAPDGTTSAAVTYDYAWYSRAETTLPFTIDENAPVGNEAQYTVETTHTYYREYGDPCLEPQSPMMQRQPCYMSKAAFNTARPQWYYYPIRVITRYVFTISIRLTSYRLSSMRASSCIYTIDCPEGHTCGYRSIWYYPHPGGHPCGPYIQVANLLINRSYCINSVYAKWLATPGACT